jgi:tetratricopeptide (TPR) repeat protein
MSSENLSAPYKKGDFIGGKYEVYGILGMGGFGIVYLVYSHKMKSVFALKTFRDEYMEDREAQERFKKEAHIWINLERHPYLVRAYLVDKISDRLFIELECISPGEDGLNSLDGYLRRRPPDLAQSLRWGIQFCYGMEYAYSKGICAHRDIKPANIMIGQNNTIKITDFGIAGVIGQARISGIKMDIRNNTVGFSCQTIEGRGFGTPTHMPPEQFTNAAACDERSDIYSFGIVLYQMATGGSLPFLPNLPKNNSDEECMRIWNDMHRLHCQAPVPRLNSPLFPIIQRCLEKEPKRRYQSFRELRSELEPLLKRLTGEVVKAPGQRELEAWEWGNKGFSLTTLGKYQEAIACYDRVLEIDPRYALAWYNKGGALKNLGKYQEAINCYDKAIEIEPRDAGAWLNKGTVLDKFDRYREAITCYDRALEINPRYALAWHNKGGALSNLGKHQEVIACYDKAIEINPRYVEAWHNKGGALSDLGKYQEAIACYDRVLEINPSYATAWHNKGFTLLIGLGRDQEAIEALENYIKFAPANQAADVATTKELIQTLKLTQNRK